MKYLRKTYLCIRAYVVNLSVPTIYDDDEEKKMKNLMSIITNNNNKYTLTKLVCTNYSNRINFFSLSLFHYRVDFQPDRGIYDLKISNASYSRDNGRFECRIKAAGTGADVHQQYYNLTILTPPQPPMVGPGNIATVLAAHRIQQLRKFIHHSIFDCSSIVHRGKQ
jgi:hypothetical protein